MEDINNAKKKPASVSQEEWDAYLLDLEYKSVTKGFDGEKSGLTKEQYIEYAAGIEIAIEEGEKLDIRIGKLCNVHIQCGCKIIKNSSGIAEWQTSGLPTVCAKCIELQSNFNSGSIKNKLEMLDKMEKNGELSKIQNLVEYIYTVDPNAEEPIMLISEEIGNDGFNGGVSGAQFQKEILTLDALGKKRIKVYINSLGGSVIDGMTIFDSIIRTKATVDTYCIGYAASIAGIIFLAGKNRYMVDYGNVMIHNPWTETGAASEYLKRTRDSLIVMLSERSGISAQVISNYMDDETWMNCEEAMNSSFATEPIKSSNGNVKRIKLAETIQDKHRECGVIMNKVFELDNKKTKKNMILNKINAKLGLNEEASEESTMESIANLLTIKNTLNEGTEAYNKMKNELEIATESYNKCKSELEELTNSMKEAETKNKAEKATEMVLNFVKMGKIKNEVAVINKWNALAIADVEMVKELLEELPVTKNAVKIPIDGSALTPSAEFDAIGLAMAKLREDMKGK